MDRKKLLMRVALLIVFIFLINSLSKVFHWYFSIWYFDMIMHFLGGLWLGLFFFWWLHPDNLSFKIIFKILIGVLLVGILWELFELFFDTYVAQNPFNVLDTTSDIFFDLAGGLFSIFYFIKKTMITPRI